MNAPRSVAGAVALAVALSSATLAAPKPTPPPAIAQYRRDQAWEGRYVFIQQCGECHGGDLGGWFGPALARGDSNLPWQSPSDVWAYMTAHMPVGNSGGLPQRDYVNVMAYLMQQAGRRPSRTALTVPAIRHDTTPLDLKP